MRTCRHILLSVLALTLTAAVLPARAGAQTTRPPATGTLRAQRQPAAALLRGPFRPIVLQMRRAQLTPAQRQQMLGIFEAHQADLRALAEKTRAARERWQQSGQVSIQERNDLQAQRAAIMQQVRSEVFALLTPAQQKRLLAHRPPATRR